MMMKRHRNEKNELSSAVMSSCTRQISRENLTVSNGTNARHSTSSTIVSVENKREPIVHVIRVSFTVLIVLQTILMIMNKAGKVDH